MATLIWQKFNRNIETGIIEFWRKADPDELTVNRLKIYNYTGLCPLTERFIIARGNKLGGIEAKE